MMPIISTGKTTQDNNVRRTPVSVKFDSTSRFLFNFIVGMEDPYWGLSLHHLEISPGEHDRDSIQTTVIQYIHLDYSGGSDAIAD